MYFYILWDNYWLKIRYHSLMKITLPFLYIFLFFSCSLLAQEKNFQIPDSLADKTNTELIKLIKKLRLKDPNLAKIYTETYHKKAIVEQNQIALIDSYFYFGHISDIQGKYINAISLINKGISLAKTDRDSILRKFYNLRGKVQEQYGKYEEAASDFNTSISIAKKFNDSIGLYIAKIGTAKMQLNTSQYFESLNSYKKLLHISENTKLISETNKVSIFIGITDNFLNMKMLDSARVYLDKGLKESIRINDSEALSYLYPFDALYYYHKNEIPKSLEILEVARKAISDLQLEDKRNIEVYYFMAQCYIVLKDYTAALNNLEKALDIIRDENNKNNTLANEEDQYVPYEYLYLLRTLTICYEYLGDEEKRDFYSEKYTKLKAESLEKDVRMDRLTFKLKDSEEVDFLKELSLRKVVAEKKIQYLYYILALLCLIGVSAYIIYRKKDRQKAVAYKALIEKISALETKSNTITQENTSSAKKTVNITDEKAQAILKGLEKFEAQELYLDSGCNLRFVAKKVKTNATYLSKILNEDKEISFTDYINDLRIQYTLKRLKSDTLFRAYSIKSISEEVGYKSADSFTKHFKKQTSLYPSYYIKKLNQEKA